MDGDGIAPGGLAVSILDHAVVLPAVVPFSQRQGIRRLFAGSQGGSDERIGIRLLVPPLIGQAFALRGHREFDDRAHAAGIINRLVGNDERRRQMDGDRIAAGGRAIGVSDHAVVLPAVIFFRHIHEEGSLFAGGQGGRLELFLSGSFEVPLIGQPFTAGSRSESDGAAGRSRIIHGLFGDAERLVGPDGDGKITGDLGQTVAVGNTGIRRKLQVLVRSGRFGADAAQRVAVGHVNHEVDLTGTGAVDQTRNAVPWMSGHGVFLTGAVRALGLVYCDGGALAAIEGCGQQGLAAYGADSVLIIVGDNRRCFVSIAVTAFAAGVGGVAFRGAGRRRHHGGKLVFAGSRVSVYGGDGDGKIAADFGDAIAVGDPRICRQLQVLV